MIQRFTFSHPLPTDSVVRSLPAENGAVPFLTPDPEGGWAYTMAEDAIVYGLGVESYAHYADTGSFLSS